MGIRLAERLRKEGKCVILNARCGEKSIADYQAYAERSFIKKILYVKSPEEVEEFVQS